MRPLRHRFAVLFFCKQHNDLVACGDTYHLNQYKDQTVWLQQSEGQEGKENHETSDNEGHESDEGYEVHEGDEGYEVHEVRESPA